MDNLFILDGYNLLYNLKRLRKKEKTEDLDNAREELIRIIRKFSDKFHNVESIVFFDGVLKSEIQKNDSLRVVFSDQDSSADDQIIKFFNKVRGKYKNVFLVSGDKKLFNYIETFNGTSLTSFQFLSRLRRNPKLSKNEHLKEFLFDKIPNKRENRLNLLKLL